MEHFKALKLNVHGKDKLIIDFLQSAFSFEAKLALFIKDFTSKSFIDFSRMKADIQISMVKRYWILRLREDSYRRFIDLTKRSTTFEVFKNSFDFENSDELF